LGGRPVEVCTNVIAQLLPESSLLGGVVHCEPCSLCGSGKIATICTTDQPLCKPRRNVAERNLALRAQAAVVSDVREELRRSQRNRSPRRVLGQKPGGVSDDQPDLVHNLPVGIASFLLPRQRRRPTHPLAAAAQLPHVVPAHVTGGLPAHHSIAPAPKSRISMHGHIPTQPGGRTEPTPGPATRMFKTSDPCCQAREDPPRETPRLQVRQAIIART